MSIFDTALELFGAISVAGKMIRKMEPGATLEVDTPDIALTIRRVRYDVVGMTIQRAPTPTPGQPAFHAPNLFEVLVEFLGEVKAAQMELGHLSPGETNDIDISDIAIGYKGVRYDILSLSVKRAE